VKKGAKAVIFDVTDSPGAANEVCIAGHYRWEVYYSCQSEKVMCYSQWVNFHTPNIVTLLITICYSVTANNNDSTNK
jgi:hypothetical protein